MARAGKWQTVRSFSTTAAESAVPTSFTSLVPPTPGEVPRLVEFGFADLTIAGSPTNVIVSFWRSFNGLTHKLGSVTLTVYTNIQPVIVECYGTEVTATVSFTAGSTPTATGVVSARGLD